MRNIFFALILLFIFSSCEKVIDIELTAAPERYVIEATMSNKAGAAMVKLSKTKTFNDDNSFKGIRNAIVTITDNDGRTFSLTDSEQSPGIYTLSSLRAVAGRTYTLAVETEGNTFTGEEKMPVYIPIAGMAIETRLRGGETRKFLSVSYQDPAGKGNAYRFIQYVNGRKLSYIFIDNDDYTDGLLANSVLSYSVEKEEDEEKDYIKSGDRVKIELHHVNAPVYRFWYSLLSSSTGASFTASPSNPVTNIKGGALGYFTVHQVAEQEVEVP